MKRLLFIIALGIFTSCNDAGVTNLEVKAVDSVLDFYDGICHRSKGINVKNGTNSTYFGLRMTGSESIEKLLNKAYLPSSNIAYLFYKNLGNESANYDEIRVTLVSKDDSEQEFVFQTALLEKVDKRLTVIDKTLNLLKTKNYEELKSMLNNDLIPFDKEELIPRLMKVEPQFGNILEFRFFGFKVIPIQNMEILHLSGAVLRDKQNNEFSIDIDLNSNDDDIYQLQYKL